MTSTRTSTWIVVAAVATVALLVALPLIAQDEPADDGKAKKEKKYIEGYQMRTFWMDKSAQRTDSVYIRIQRYTTREERATYLTALQEGGTPALTKLFEEAEEIGFIRFPGGRQGLKYVWSWPNEDGTDDIIFATDRPLGWVESSRAPRTANQTLSVGKMTMPDKGKGEGQVLPAAEVTWDSSTMHMGIEFQGQQPMRLVQIRRTK
jgi:hypothetical protein